MRRDTCLFALVVLPFCTVSAGAVTIHVPADQPTIQAGIVAAANGDTVLVSPGTYTENLTVSKPIWLVSASGPEATVLAATGSRNLRLEGITEDTLRVIGFTFSNTTGNGIESNHSLIRLQDCRFNTV